MATPVETAKAWVEAFNRGDIKGVMALYADNCVNAQPHLPAPIHGKAAIEHDFGGFMSAFPDGRMEATSIIAQGDLVSMEWTFVGPHQGPLDGPAGQLPPTNRKVTITGAEITKHDSRGLIVEERGYFDLASFMTQLGVMAPPQPA